MLFYYPIEVEIGKDRMVWIWDKRKRIFEFHDILEVIRPSSTLNNLYAFRTKKEGFIRMGGVDEQICKEFINAYMLWRNNSQ
jgi:hypothetical protein